MPSDRKFHKRVITVTVLSMEPYLQEDLMEIAKDIAEDDEVGGWSIGPDEEISAVEMVKELKAVGSKPEYLNLTENGEDDHDCDHCCEQGDDD